MKEKIKKRSKSNDKEKISINESKYCKCEKIKSVHSEFDDFMCWNVCDECNKIVEFTFESVENYK